MQSSEGGGTIKVAARNEAIAEGSVLPLAPGNYIRFEIIDHGEGIPAEHQKYRFDPYFTTKENGSGLGLTVSYSIIKRHGGYLTFEAAGGGPSLPGAASPARKDVNRGERLSGRALVIDDDEVFLRVAGNMLKYMGMSADYAAHGEEALDRCRRALEAGYPYDIVIVDLTIPGKIGGRETMARMSDIDPSVRAIVSSGYSNYPVMAHYGDYWFSDVVAKPYRIEDLESVITRVFQRRARAPCFRISRRWCPRGGSRASAPVFRAGTSPPPGGPFYSVR
ncbi:MAG: response regulator [Spirochaetes bacterium]|nr:response regulator [Spirochaetota bacterium]